MTGEAPTKGDSRRASELIPRDRERPEGCQGADGVRKRCEVIVRDVEPGQVGLAAHRVGERSEVEARERGVVGAPRCEEKAEVAHEMWQAEAPDLLGGEEHGVEVKDRDVDAAAELDREGFQRGILVEGASCEGGEGAQCRGLGDAAGSQRKLLEGEAR